MKNVSIKTKAIPLRPRSKNYPANGNVYSSGGSATVINNNSNVDIATLRAEFLSKKSDDITNGIVNFLKGIRLQGSLINKILKEASEGDLSDEAVMTAARINKEIEDALKNLENKFIRKDIPDSTKYLLSLFGGAVFGKDGFAEGLTGFGAKIDKDGNGEMRKLKVWEELIVPLLVYNRVEVVIGDKWRSPGAGEIETVTPDVDSEGNQLATGTATLKLRTGEIGAIAVDDMDMGIFHFGTDSDAAEDSDDSKGNFTFAGFTTAYWRITEVLDDNNKTFRYALRPGYTVHPAPQMTFSCRGNFTNKDRQTSVYETRTYTRMLKNQNTWEISAANIALQYGDLSNLNVFGMNMEGYSMYLNSVYFAGTITQVKPDGTPVKTANDRTDWEPGSFADYYDRVSYQGGLWLCVAENGTNTIPSKDDPAWLLQVKAGDSITSYKRWQSADTPYPYAAIVPFAYRVFMAAKETSNPPYPLLKDSDGNYLLVTEDGGKTYHYIITEYTLSEDWTLLLDVSGIKDGEDGASLSVRYSSDKANWHDVFQEGDVWMQQKLGNGAWSSAMRIVGEAGTNGKDGQWQDYQFAVNSSLTVAPTSGWQDAPPAVGTGQYLWMRTGVVIPPATSPASWVAVRIGGEKGNPGSPGTDGISVKNGGRWKTGLVVEPMTLVTMGGKVFLSKVSTSNPPMWTLTDRDGSRLVQSDGSYILTGEINTGEWDLLVENGADGKDAVVYEYIYQRTVSQSAPSTPGISQSEGYIPSGWSATSQGVSESYPYEWRCERKRSAAGIWSDWSSPVLVHSFGKQGIQGCVIRDSEWASGVQYRNDSALTTNTGVRFIDVALVRNDSTTTGWDAYQCKKTHVSSTSITYTNTEYWDKFDTNVGAIFTSLIIAKNAKLKFLTSNELTITNSKGQVMAGLSGSESGQRIRIWAGGSTPDSAPFRAAETGEFWATKAHIEGEINATSGVFRNISSPNGSFRIDNSGNVDITGKFQTAASGNRIVLDPSGNTLSFITSGGVANCAISFGTYNGYSTTNIYLRSSSGSTIYDSASIAPHELRLSDKMVSGLVKLNCNELSIVGNSKTAIFGANEISLTVSGTKYTGFTGYIETAKTSGGRALNAHFYNGILYEVSTRTA